MNQTKVKNLYLCKSVQSIIFVRLFINFSKNQHKQHDMYPLEIVAPMSQELTAFGFKGLSTPEQVSEALDQASGTTMVVVNSVCGCAAANARPGAKMALQGDKKPDNLVTVFAGVDQAATAKAREYMLPYPPSSPAIALFKDGKLVHFLERHHIEGRSAEIIAANLQMAFERYC
jgi:putative YphP/YqiW family bacilliredoxin